MLVFTEKISGTRVEGYEIKPIFERQIVFLSEVLKVVQRQETMDYILDTLRFRKVDNDWYTTMDWDTILKLSVLENYPGYEKEFTEYFGGNWLNHYIRFSH